MFEDLKNKFEILKESEYQQNIHSFYIKKEDILNILSYLKNSPSYLFERLDCIYSVDINNSFEVIYVLQSDKYNTKCTINCNISYEEEMPSVTSIYSSANFDEREIFDLFGVKFNNHPNLKRILLPESFEGHPLRKSYKMQDERLRWNNGSN